MSFAEYSDVDDTAAENPAGLRGSVAVGTEVPAHTIGPGGSATRGQPLPTANGVVGSNGVPGAGSSSSQAAGPRITPGPDMALGWGAGLALAVGGLAMGL